MPVGTGTRDSRSNRPDADDWLGGDQGFDWVEDDEASAQWPERKSEQPRRGSRAEPVDTDGRYGAEHPDDATIRRRRTIGLLVALAIVGSVIAIAVIAFGGGSTDTTTPTEQTPPTTPATTTEQPAQSQTTTSTTPPAAATPQTVDLAEGDTLRQGSSGDTVVQLQNGLTALGFDPGPADGIFGPVTEAAVLDFQRSNGLDADGVVGANTVAALNNALAQLPSSGT
jgi:hypothetical protein